MKRALLGALLLVACRKDAPEGSTSATPSSSVAPTETADDTPVEAGVSKWSKTSTEGVELVVAPNRTAWLTFGNGGYNIHRGERSQRLPREWFGAGPPRKDLSISGDGSYVAIPDESGVSVYLTNPPHWLGRFAAPQTGAQGKMSNDGKFVVWTAPGAPCSMTEIATKTLQKKCP